MLNSGGIKLSTCQTLTPKLRGCVDAGLRGIPHVARFIQPFNRELSISEIARRTGHSRGTVRKYLRAQVPPSSQERSKKPGKPDGYREYILCRLLEIPQGFVDFSTTRSSPICKPSSSVGACPGGREIP
jgi:hypothetical protein